MQSCCLWCTFFLGNNGLDKLEAVDTAERVCLAWLDIEPSRLWSFVLIWEVNILEWGVLDNLEGVRHDPKVRR